MPAAGAAWLVKREFALKQSLLTIWAGLTRPARLVTALLVAGCVLAAAFGSGFLAFAQSVLPGSSWTLYGNLIVTGAPLFRTPEQALDHYFSSTQTTAPYTQACQRYYSNYYPQGVCQQARALATHVAGFRMGRGSAST